MFKKKAGQNCKHKYIQNNIIKYNIYLDLYILNIYNWVFSYLKAIFQSSQEKRFFKFSICNFP